MIIISRKTQYCLWGTAFFGIILYILFQWIGATRLGAGLTPDSINYINYAKSIIENKDLSGMGGHWGPFYPIFLASFSYINSNVLYVAKWLQMSLLVANLVLFGYVLYSSSQRSLSSTITGVFVVATSLVMLENHSLVSSEPLFLFWSLAGIYFLSLFFEKDDNRFYLVTSALLVGLAIVTRYAGFSLLITACIGMVLFGSHGLKKRILDISIFLMISMFPIVLWLTHLFLRGNWEKTYSFQLNRVPGQDFLNGSREILLWFLLPGNKPYLLLVVLFVVTGLMFTSIRLSSDRFSSRMCEISLIFVVVYFVFVSCAKFFVYVDIPLDRRILLPANYFLFLGIVLLAHRITTVKPIRWIGYLFLTYFLLVGTIQVRAQNEFVEFAQDGLVYSRRTFVESEIIDWINKNKIDTVLYSNGPDPLSVYTNVDKIKTIPRHTSTETRKRNENVIQELNAMAEELSENAGYIVLFSTITWRWYLPTEDQMLLVLPMKLVFKGQDGVIYEIEK